MSIFSGQVIPFIADADSVARGQMLTAGLCGVIGVLVAHFAGAFRAKSVIGPQRFDERDLPVRLWLLILLAIAVRLLTENFAELLMHGAQIAKMTAEQKAQWQLPARDVIVLSALVPVVSVIVILIADRFTLRNGIKAIGLTRLSRGVLLGGIGALAAVPLTIAAATLTQWLWIKLNLPTPQEHELLTQLHLQSSLFLRGLIVFSAVIGAPFYEELLFRGHLQSAIARTLGSSFPEDSAAVRWMAIVFAAALFALMHNAGPGAQWMLPPLFLLAICFGYVYERTGNLWAPILMHAAFNAVSIGVALVG